VPQYGRVSVAPATVQDWRKQAASFDRISTFNAGSATLAGTDGPERVPTTAISWDLFDLLGVRPILGRTFTEAEDAPGRNSVAVMSYGTWERRFGKDPGVLGRTVMLSGEPATIVGVMPPGFFFPSRDVEVWRPIALNPANAMRGGHFLGVIARLKAGVGLAQAAAEMKGISERLARQYPEASANESAEVIQLKDQIVGPIRPALLTLFAAVAVVVLIACANVANLLLVRASVREKEMAIRGALGAGRRRLVLQLLAESLVLAVAGGALGLLLAYFAVPLVRTLSAGSIPRVNDVTLDGNVLAFRVTLPSNSYPEEHHRTAFFDALLAKLAAVPQVRGAGMAQTIPMRGDYVLSVEIQGRPTAKPKPAPSANYRSVSPGYFQTLGIPIKRGRAFSGQDTAKSPMVAIVDEAFAKRHFPDEDPIGRGIDIGNGTDGFYQIVGVVGSVRYEGLGSTPEPTMYVPFAQDVFSTMWLVARTDGDPRLQAAAARDAVKAIDPTLPAYSIVTLASVVSDSVAQRRFAMLLLAVFALIAVFLAAIGLYGMVAYSVGQRTQEIGLRMAIGAQRADVFRLIVGGGMKLALIGVIVGTGGALAAARFVEAMLFDVTPFDPASYAATAAVLFVVAALACYLPARRAMSVDPLSALRQE
jgi:ABC-type antimicrobial peptide transport system permease subunit